MEKKLLSRFEKILKQERARLEKQLDSIEKDTLRVPEAEQGGELPDEFHMADVGSVAFDRERDLSLGLNAHDILERVELALERVKKGNYGFCGHCGRKIDIERLEALPYADQCIRCKVREERTS